MHNFKLLHISDLWTIGCSLVLSALLFVIAAYIPDASIWRDYFIGLSTSVVTIGLTIFIVDLFRRRQAFNEGRLPTQKAINEAVIAANLPLIIVLDVFYRDQKDTHKKFYAEVVAVGDKSTSRKLATTLDLTRPMLRTSSINILNNATDEDLVKLRKYTQDAALKLDELLRRYDFYLSDSELRKNFLALINSTEAFLRTFDFLDISDELAHQIVGGKSTQSTAKKHNISMGTFVFTTAFCSFYAKHPYAVNEEPTSF